MNDAEASILISSEKPWFWSSIKFFIQKVYLLFPVVPSACGSCYSCFWVKLGVIQGHLSYPSLHTLESQGKKDKLQ